MSNYFPFANMIFVLFTFISIEKSLVLFSALYSAGILYFIFRFNVLRQTSLRLGSSIIFSFFTFGYIFCLDRGNVEGFLFFFLLGFFWFFQKRNLSTAAMFLAAAISMKLYPLVFLLLFISERKYAEIAFTLLLVLMLSFGSLYFHHGSLGENWYFISHGLGAIKKNNPFLGEAPNFIYTGVSLFSAMKILVIKANLMPVIGRVLIGLHLSIVLFLTIIFSLYVVFAGAKIWKKVFVLVTMILILPQFSFEYKMLQVVLPLLFFLNDEDAKIENSRAAYRHYWFYLMVFVLLLIPKSYYYFPGFSGNGGTWQNISEAVILNPLLLLFVSLFFVLDAIKKKSWRVPETWGRDDVVLQEIENK
ncbi:MAG: glycosyltransferase 87 family protein [Proteobacteria bacterium]|nr:glycosyltransferase 87 family protein [Pseudomonadota bacterium]